jgi:hypothetical protein
METDLTLDAAIREASRATVKFPEKRFGLAPADFGPGRWIPPR